MLLQIIGFGGITISKNPFDSVTERIRRTTQ